MNNYLKFNSNICKFLNFGNVSDNLSISLTLVYPKFNFNDLSLLNSSKYFGNSPRLLTSAFLYFEKKLNNSICIT